MCVCVCVGDVNVLVQQHAGKSEDSFQDVEGRGQCGSVSSSELFQGMKIKFSGLAESAFAH